MGFGACATAVAAKKSRNSVVINFIILVGRRGSSLVIRCSCHSWTSLPYLNSRTQAQLHPSYEASSTWKRPSPEASPTSRSW